MVIFSDHKNLTYHREARKLNRRQVRWSLYLSEFNVKLTHILGSKMVQSDTLSRRPDFIPDEDNDNKDITMLPDNLFINLINLDLQKCIANCKDMDRDVTEAQMLLLEQKPATLKNNLEDWTLEKMDDKNILFFKGKNYIPRDNEL